MRHPHTYGKDFNEGFRRFLQPDNTPQIGFEGIIQKNFGGPVESVDT